MKLKLPPVDQSNDSFIPSETNALPPIYTATRSDFQFSDATNDGQLIATLHNETVTFAVQRNFYVLVRIVKCKSMHRLSAVWLDNDDIPRFSVVLHEQNCNQFHHQRNASRQSGRNCHFAGNGRFQLSSQRYFPASKWNLPRCQKRWVFLPHLNARPFIVDPSTQEQQSANSDFLCPAIVSESKTLKFLDLILVLAVE